MEGGERNKSVIEELSASPSDFHLKEESKSTGWRYNDG